MNTNFFHIATVASAGTGKTYSLVENYLAALFGLDDSGIKKRPNQILALTFTQKAAHEMRIRIAGRLGQLLNDSAIDPLVQLSRSKGVQFPKNEEIKIILRSLPNAPIATFHAFCSSLLKQEAALLGLFGEMDILEPNDELELAKNTMRSLLLAKIADKSQNYRNLVARFRMSSSIRNSGLIDTVLNVYFKLFEKGVSPADLSYYDERQKICPSDIEKCLISIDHALREFSNTPLTAGARARVVEITANFNRLQQCLSKLDEHEMALAFQVLRNSVKGNFGTGDYRRALVLEVLKLGALLVDYFVVEDEKALISLIGEFHAQFSQLKLDMMKLSYSDLLVRVRDALRDNLDFRQKIKQRFKHIMVDEYQDTSPLQEQIVALLAENKTHQAVVHSSVDLLEHLNFQFGPSLFVVGDKKQSIYGFRGADIKLFDRILGKMQHSHQNSGSYNKRILKTNYRSSKKVIELINDISGHILKDQAYSVDDDLLPHKTDMIGHYEIWVSDNDQGLSKNASNLLCASHGIAQLLAHRPDLSPKDITVLVRRIKAAASIKSELSLLGIESRIIGGEGFFQQQEIIDLLSALKLLVDPSHSIATLTVLRSPLVLLTDDELLRVSEDKPISLMTAENALSLGILSEKSSARLNVFLKTLEEIKTRYQQGLSEALDILIERTDFSYTLGLYHNAQQRLANVNKLRFLLSGSRDNFIKKIEDFYRKIDSNFGEPLAPDASSENVVRIMTIHQSKGLEFKVVVLADSESALPHESDDLLFDKEMGLRIKPKLRAIADCTPVGTEREGAMTRFDTIRAKNQAQEKAEMARLLYVALTRAQEEIYIVASTLHSVRKADSLLGLFLTAVKDTHHKNIIFNTPKKILGEREYSENNVQLFVPHEKNTRIFSSALITPAHIDFSALIDVNLKSAFKGIDGNLAHSIIADVGSQIAKIETLEKNTLTHLIDACGRSLGDYEDEEKFRKTLTACQFSLEILHSAMKKGRAIFEKPLFSQPTPHLVIEGFSDLVIEFDDYFGVIEFKSSYRLATHPDTYAQVFAYAAALKKLKPVKYAVLLIGAKSPIKWQEFNHECEKLLLGVLEHISVSGQGAEESSLRII